MGFEQSHAEFIEHHLGARTGERRGRLERGHSHGEKLFLENVWCPLYGNFDGLHPEFEIVDFRGKSYFADFMFRMGFLKFVIEIKGFNSHVKEMDRHKFCADANRELYMQGLGYRVLSVAYDSIANHPEQVVVLFRMILSQFQSTLASPDVRMGVFEKEIVRLALTLPRRIRPKDVESHFPANHRTAVAWLRAMVAKGWLSPVHAHPGSKVLEYELRQDRLSFF
ncbi:DUF559 domain-containing protein [Cohnella suwonensis]|uniref:DUF559 domain-containing protein n=1 Tax=Cohnella suwonensis TaxID=696072 RepID=A0ABW0M0C0_9BACL